MLPLSATTSPGKRRTFFGTPAMRVRRASCPAGFGVGVAVGVGVNMGVGVAVGVGVQPAHTVGEGVGLAVGSALPTGAQAENSEVSAYGSVAVTVTLRASDGGSVNCTLNDPSPLESVEADDEPTNVRPSIDESQLAVSLKNSSVKVVFGVLFSDPLI